MKIEKIVEEVKSLKSPEYYFNRELGFIEFNKRVLLEAENQWHPLLERLKFVGIFSSNLDEFFMIRVAGIKRQIAADVVELSYDGMTPKEQIVEIRKRLIPLYDFQEKMLKNEILPALKREGVEFLDIKDLKKYEKLSLEKYFLEKILPILTPLTLDSAHPFPRIINRAINIVFVLNDKNTATPEQRIAFLQLPHVLPRLIRLEDREGYKFILMEQVVKEFAGILFPGLEILDTNVFRVTRDADIEIAEDEAEDLLFEIAEQIKQRRWGTAVVRLEVTPNMPDYLVNLLRKSLDIHRDDIYVHDRPLKMPDFMELIKLDLRHLKDRPFATRPLPEFQVEGVSVFKAIDENELMVHHPYDSFTNNTLKFINRAADDPDVVAIKMTLYRTGMNSPIVAALKRAAESGKDVTAFVELKARFDEENNILWAKELEQTGVHVVYGVLGLKTHCKIALVVRQTGEKLKTYLHLSTGNYNQVTARIYTDIGFFTAREEFGYEAIHLFNYLTGYSYYKDWKHFIVAPINLYQEILLKIEREIEKSTPENPGLIFAKMNSLVHRIVIPALYRASQKGVRVKLLVRGICCLKPDIPGISENIEVRSILGRFLEHSRIYYFKNGGEEEFYLSSADWMSRNLHKRVELMFPVYDEKVREQLRDILNYYWKDNTKSWVLQNDGSYKKREPEEGEESFSAQEFFLEETQISREKTQNR